MGLSMPRRACMSRPCPRGLFLGAFGSGWRADTAGNLELFLGMEGPALVTPRGLHVAHPWEGSRGLSSG